MNYEPNTTHWKEGDLVIHDADDKRPYMLMRVIGYDSKTGECKTHYITPNMNRDWKLSDWLHDNRTPAPANWKNTSKIWRNDIKYLHDPARFGIKVEQ